MAQKLYPHLIKPTLVRQAPAGLYPKPLIWMEAKDMEGFNAHFVYGFITEPGTVHPLEGMVVHPYDEVLVFAGYQDGDVRRIEAEISIVLGEEREVHTFHKPTYVVIPRGSAARPGHHALGRPAARALHHRPISGIQGETSARRHSDHRLQVRPSGEGASAASSPTARRP